LKGDLPQWGKKNLCPIVRQAEMLNTIGVSEYKLSDFVPAELVDTLPIRVVP